MCFSLHPTSTKRRLFVKLLVIWGACWLGNRWNLRCQNNSKHPKKQKIRGTRPSDWYSIKNWMGPYQRTPKLVGRVIRYSGLGVRSVGPVGDFLEIWVLEIFEENLQLLDVLASNHSLPMLLVKGAFPNPNNLWGYVPIFTFIYTK